MDDNNHFVTHRQDIQDELCRYINIKKVKPGFINDEGEFESDLNGYDFFISIDKVEVSRSKKMNSKTIAKQNIVTLDDFRKFNNFMYYDDFVENFYEKNTFYSSINEVVITVPPVINFRKFNTEVESDFMKRCLLFFNNQDYYVITPVINAKIKSFREFRHIDWWNKKDNGEIVFFKIDRIPIEEEDPTYLPIIYQSIIFLGDLLINSGVKKFMINPPPSLINYNIEMEEYWSENEQIDFYDWEELADDETNRWDEETGGSWRIENDFG